MWTYDDLNELQLALLEKHVLDLAGDVDVKMTLYVREALLRLIAVGSPEITVQITSNGGRFDSGIDVYDMLRTYPGKKTGVICGHANSMAAVILQACDVRQCRRHASILIHNIYPEKIALDALRNKKKLAPILKILEAQQARINTIFAGRTRRRMKEVRRACAAEKKMSAGEALAFGLVDEIV